MFNTTTIDGKKVIYKASSNTPSKGTIKKVYSRIPDNKRIPIVFETKNQYLNEYIKNQEQKKKIQFTPREKKVYKQHELKDMSNIISRYTTNHNPYIDRRVVFFTDKPISKRQFAMSALHEYGHEVWEKNPKVRRDWHAVNRTTAPTAYGRTDKQEDFAESYMLYKTGGLNGSKRGQILQKDVGRNDVTPLSLTSATRGVAGYETKLGGLSLGNATHGVAGFEDRVGRILALSTTTRMLGNSELIRPRIDVSQNRKVLPSVRKLARGGEGTPEGYAAHREGMRELGLDQFIPDKDKESEDFTFKDVVKNAGKAAGSLKQMAIQTQAGQAEKVSIPVGITPIKKAIGTPVKTFIKGVQGLRQDYREAKYQGRAAEAKREGVRRARVAYAAQLGEYAPVTYEPPEMQGFITSSPTLSPYGNILKPIQSLSGNILHSPNPVSTTDNAYLTSDVFAKARRMMYDNVGKNSVADALGIDAPEEALYTDNWKVWGGPKYYDPRLIDAPGDLKANIHTIALQHYNAISTDVTSKAYAIRKKRAEGYYRDLTPEQYFDIAGKPESLTPESHMSNYPKAGSIQVKQFAEHIKSPTKSIVVEAPFAFNKYNQEGRHRVLGAQLAGEKTVPVWTNLPREFTAPEVRKAFEEKMATKGHRFDQSYAEEWKGRFESGHPNVYMGKTFRGGYAETLKEKGLEPPKEWLEGDVKSEADIFSPSSQPPIATLIDIPTVDNPKWKYYSSSKY